MEYLPIEIAKKLKISTSALRHYESWGIVPPPKRKANGYRVYTEEHLAYFECIRGMYPFFDMGLIKKVLTKLQNKEVDAALWLVSEAKASLYQDRMIAEKTIEVLDIQELDELDSRGRRKWMSIGEVSEETSVPGSAIRHWEKMGLITPSRDPENGYRRFNRWHVRQILIIRTLKSTVYSLDLIKKVIMELEHKNVERAREIARDSLKYLNDLNLAQLRGTHYLYRLCKTLNLIE